MKVNIFRAQTGTVVEIPSALTMESFTSYWTWGKFGGEGQERPNVEDATETSPVLQLSLNVTSSPQSGEFQSLKNTNTLESREL